MKRKFTLMVFVLTYLMGMPPCKGQTLNTVPSASKDVYDFKSFADTQLLDHFAELVKKGRKYPTNEELKSWGIYEELEFVRSHVRKRNIMSRTDRLVSDTHAERDLLMNIPCGSGKTYGGYPSHDFMSDNFSMWNYTNLFGAWNHGLFQAPGSWADAAHKNGTDMLSGMKFFDTTGGRQEGSGNWKNFITQKENGNFKYAQALINLLRFLGLDGINYNWEATGFNDTEVIKFHQELYKIAKQEKFDNFHIMLYTSRNALTRWDNEALWGKNGIRTTELMLNYSSSDFTPSMSTSVQMAEQLLGTSKGLYAGVWIVSMNRSWDRLNADENARKCGVCLWGEHSESRFWSYNTGGDPNERMSNYQMLLECAFSGGNRNPLTRPSISNSGNDWEWSGTTPPLSKFAGLATWIPERSAIEGKLPFSTYFNLGNGDRYSYKGKKTAGPWYNMANQDIVPTYRWLVVQSGTNTVSNAIQPELTNRDAYTGGACLQLNGFSTATSTDIVLYKTSLKGTQGDIYANVAIKSGKDGTNPSNLYLIVRIGNSTWKEYPVGNTTDKNWTEKRIKLDGISATDAIERIGLRVKDCNENYRLLVGKLEINDGVKATPSNIKDLTIQVKEETKTSLSVKASWGIDAQGANGLQGGLVYNDEGNIDHFEILYKNGENGRVSEVARTTQWAAYVGNIQLPKESDEPYIGVRSVSTDLKTYSPVVWTKIDRANQSDLPVAKDNPYGTVELDMVANGAEVAQKIRYITDFKTEGAEQDIIYHAEQPTGGANYVDATDKVIKVKQGQTVTVKFKGYEAKDNVDGSHDDLRYCMGKGWLDLDGDHLFNPADLTADPNHGECLFHLGKVRAGSPEQVQELVSHSFTVPQNARKGMSRLRIVFSDAWFAGSLVPIGKFNKGFAIDFGVEIVGDNAERPVPADTHDQGEAAEPEGLTTTGITEVAGAASALQVTNEALNFNNVEKAWIFSVDGRLVEYLTSPQSYRTNKLAKGVYLVKMQNKNVIRSQKITVQ
ncbi:glycosyl hydrolase family 85 [Hoylesella oralis ATCC 33269]|uniref:Glycosyl hydrolase family 85 n=1 Tax=Hoylesella oralis ATCC 33269 TaxID=873533 RepID=E7RRQ9_9BACT|nr:T9SS type A sorting domain-containing protein [Hoylesella oralis]EFZ36947.1 glycosyl hydrolase family 85 [Hoylesella oralis ATCC 33269]EPH18711.1 por secretion system C-terminal sorting domain-containing protein [Hoylesella oralis HGA0225]SHF77130.1 Por secretion system C-terminal sorting domain-containing protein [Hoylesella oralis]